MLGPISQRVRAMVGRRRADRGPAVLFEFVVLDGVADIVMLELDSRLVEQRESWGLTPVIDEGSVRLLAALRTGPRPASALALEVGMSRRVVSQVVLPRLALAGWVQRGPDRSWTSARAYQPLARWIVAIEAKRREWRHAVWQARRYRRFANRSIAVLDASTNLTSATEAIRTQTQVGLARLDSGGRMETLHLPPWGPPYSEVEFALAGERAWAMTREGRASGSLAPVFGRMLLATRGADPRCPDASVGFPHLE